jgi:uncharacterized protein YggE
MTFPSGALLFVTLLTFSMSPLRAEDAASNRRTISTTGESSVYVTPDEVTISVGVETFDRSLDNSKEDNDKRSRTLLAAIKEAGVEDKHVQTDMLRVQIDYPSGGPPKGIDGYRASRSYRVTLKDPKKTEALVDACLKHGANQFFGIEYRSTELRKHRDEARKMAIKAAKEKAELLAGELSETIGRPRTISEGASNYFGWAGAWGRGAMGMTQNSFQVQNNGVGIEGETIPIGQIAITAQVSVTFDLKE